MAEYKFFLRPSADISVEHELIPEDSPNAYSLINEENDDFSTYLILKGVVGETVTATSSFKMSGVRPSDARDVFYASVEGLSTNAEVVATVNGQSFILNEVGIFGGSYSSKDFVEAMKSYNESTEVILTFTNTITVESGAKIASSIYIYQVYIRVLYGNGVFRKVNNKWKTTNTVYQKINGIWTELENGYDVVGSKLSKMGHNQEMLSSVKPNCTDTGLTIGYKCSVCGEVFLPQEIIPANGHSYVSAGDMQICEECGYIDGLGFVELTYHGTATELSVARHSMGATTVGNYALFGGGYHSEAIATVDAYDSSLTRTTPTVLSAARSSLAATTVGNYAIFGGGGTAKNAGSYNTLHVRADAYDSSLTWIFPPELTAARFKLAATTVGNYALFAGGEDNSNTHVRVDAYDSSLTRTIPAELSVARHSMAATTVGNYALFGGGEYKNSSNVSVTTEEVDAYDSSLTRTIPTVLSLNRSRLAATTVGNYALFGGGIYTSSSGDSYSTVDAYDLSLVRTTLDSYLSVSRSRLAATTVGNYALFGGGSYSISTATVDAYDTFLTRTTPTVLSAARTSLAATTVGNYALFAGGDTGSVYSVVDAYELQPIS